MNDIIAEFVNIVTGDTNGDGNNSTRAQIHFSSV